MIAKKAIRCVIGMLWYGFAGVTVLAAVLLTLARLLLPLAEDYRAEAETALSEYAGQTIRVDSLKAEWNGFEPQLHFSDVRLLDKQDEKILFQFADAKMGIDIFASIKNQDFVPSSFTVSGIELSITRHKDESFSIDGLPTATDEKNNYSDLVFNWLLRQPDIGIESSTIIWTDVPLNEKNIVFKQVNLRLKNDIDTHQLTGHVLLPEKLGKEVDFALEMAGTIDTLSEWYGSVYIKANDLRPAVWWRKPLREGVTLSEGKTNLEVWGQWQENSLQSLEGKISLADLAFSGERAKNINWKSVDTDIIWNQNDKEWMLHLGKLLLKTEQGDWPVSDLSLRHDRGTQKFAAVSKYMQLSDILPVVDAFQLLDSTSNEKLALIQPRVALHNTSLLISSENEQWHVDGRFSDLHLQAHNKIPGVSGASGSFVVNNEQGSLQLDSNKVVIDSAGLFREPVDLQKLTGSMQWQKNNKGWSIEAADFDLINPDLTLRTSMTMQIPDTGSPDIDLLVGFKNADASKTYKYLPVRFLEKKTIDWLDKSIIKGTSPSGKFVLRGPLDKFPYDHGEGKFEVRFDVIDGELDYEPGWPLISDMQGEVIFSGRSLDIIGKTGRIFNANVHDVTAHIDDIELDDPLLELKGLVDTSTPDLVKYVIAANLAEGYNEELKQLVTQGEASLKLDIKIPTSSGNGVVEGFADLKNAQLSLKGNDLQLKDINGKVFVSNEGLQGEGINARLFKTPVKIRLSHSEDAATALSIYAKGQFDLNKLIKEKYKKDIPVISKGVTEWIASLSFRDPQGDTHPVELALASELKNVAINLPAPLAKDADAIVPLKLSTFINTDKDFQVEIDYGDDVSAIVALKEIKNNLEYAGASIAFGDTLPIPPSAKRVSIVGQLDNLSFDDWLTYSSSFNWGDAASTGNNSLPWLEEINLEVASLMTVGYNFNVEKFRLIREDEHWHSFIEADRIKGEVQIPYDTSTDLVKADFEYLKIIRPEGDASDVSIDPREIPGVVLSVDNLVFDGVELGSLNMAVSKTANGLSMDKFAVVSPDLRFTASGNWQVENDEQITRFNTKLKAKKFSTLLENLGYSVGFEAGKSRNVAQLQWQGSPFQFAVKNLTGTLQIKIDKGQLLDVSPGAGRVFGLLSLQALPRRLTLDFSDLFKKGFSFDRIKGNFQLDQGDAYTTDLYLDGPAARLDVSGRTGLVVRDYDQLITVTPDLTGGLPIAGALVGGPIAGGVVFALDKLLRPAIDDITRYQYTVTGGWDDPQVVKLEEEKQALTETEQPE